MTQTRKVVINARHGGFGLSPKGTARLAELQGRECYFYVHQTKPTLDVQKYVRVSEDVAAGSFMFFAFDVPDAETRMLGRDNSGWSTLTPEERQARNEEYKTHQIDGSEAKRDDPMLIQVVEDLGEAANGSCARLQVVEIPADVEWTIEEYDGYEHVAEAHRTWP